MAASASAHFELPSGSTATQAEGEPTAQVETEEEDDAISFPLLHADSSPSDSEDDGSEKAYHIEIEGLEPLGEGDEPEQRRGVSKLGIGKKSWTAAEDDILAEIVAKNGAQRWSTVASHLPGRAGKQCRERWFNHLCPEVKKGSWTEEEDRVIMESVQRYGTKWSAIVKLMPGRTDNAIKNRYNSAMRRYKRLQRLQEAAERGEGEMPKIRARSTSGSVNLALKKRKRDLGESEETDTGSEAVAVSRPKVQAKEDASLADIKIDLAQATSEGCPDTTDSRPPGASTPKSNDTSAKTREAGTPRNRKSKKNSEGPPSASKAAACNWRKADENKRIAGSRAPTTDEERTQLAALIASTNEGHTMPPLTELDLDGVLNNGISPNSASAFLSQISPTQLGQPHMFDSSARASGDGTGLLLDDSGSGSGAKSSPFDFSSALQELESSGKNSSRSPNQSTIHGEMSSNANMEVMRPPSRSPSKAQANKRSRGAKAEAKHSRGSATEVEKGQDGKSYIGNGGAFSVTPVQSHKQSEPDSKEQRLSTGSILDMLAQLNEQGFDQEDGNHVTSLRSSYSEMVPTPISIDPTPAGYYLENNKPAHVPESTSPSSGHLSPINPVQLNELLTSF